MRSAVGAVMAGVLLLAVDSAGPGACPAGGAPPRPPGGGVGGEGAGGGAGDGVDGVGGVFDVDDLAVGPLVAALVAALGAQDDHAAAGPVQAGDAPLRGEGL